MLKSIAQQCVRRRTYVFATWLAVLIGLVAVLALAGNAFSDNSKLPSSDSATAYTLLGNAGSHAASGTSGTIVWHTDSGSAVSGVAKTDMESALAHIATVDGVVSVASPFTASGTSQISKDGHTAYATVLFDSKKHTSAAKDIAKKAETPGLTVQTGGAAFTNSVPSEIGESIGVLAALVILLLVFRSGWAAALPIITAVAGVGVSSVAVMLLSHLIAMSSIVTSMSALVGLGVGIDYALFIVNRQRKALRAGADIESATATALSTSGRAVLFAGATVIVALLGMLILGVGFLTGIAVAAAVTVAFTVIAATTLLPAMLGKVGLRVLSKRDRRALRDRIALSPDTSSTTGQWARWAGVVERRPKLTALGALILLVALAAPVVAMRLGSSDASSDPKGIATRSYYDTMSSAFGDGFNSHLLVVAETPNATSQAAWTTFVHELPSVSGVASVTSPAAVGGSTLSMVSITPITTSQAKATADLVSELRDDAKTVEAGTDLQIHVGGTTATAIDFAEALTSKLPTFLIIIAVLGFLLLMVAFRSLLIPAMGAIGNILSISVALGSTVALFQWGWGPSLFGIGGGAPVEYIVAMLIVGVMFGLSMDYHVFLVSRMHEEWTRTGDHNRALRAGIGDTGKVIATAAAIMGCVFVSFGFAGLRTASEFGVGLAIAVLADAFLMRLTIIPAAMHLIGKRSWGLPRAVDKVLPHVSVEGDAADVSDDPGSAPVSQPLTV